MRPQRREDNRGRPWHDTRAVLNGVVWILGSGAQWAEMPAKYPPYQTCHRRFQQWVGEGKLVEALRLLAKHLHERGKLHLDEAFVDATFASAKKGASRSARPGAARAPRSSLSPLVTVFLRGPRQLCCRGGSRRCYRKRFASRVQACGGCSGRMLPRRTTRATDRRQGLRLGRPRRADE